MGTTELPGVEDVFDLVEGRIFVVYRSRHIGIPSEREL